MSGRAVFHPKQVGFVLASCSISVALAGVRAGKTHAGAFKTLAYALSHPCAEDEFHLVCSPTYPMSKVPVEKLHKLLHDKRVFPVCPLVRYIKSDRVFVLTAVGGAVTRIKVVSMSDPDKVRGLKALSAWLDEGAYMDDYAFDVVLGRVADVGGPIWITTTPAGYNFVFDLYEQAKQERDAGVALEQRSVRFFHWTSFDNPFMDTRGRQRLVQQYDSRTAAQEVEAKFVKQAGLVYHAYGKHNLAPYRLDRAKPVWVGQDFNVERMATTFSQPILSGGVPGMHTFEDRLADNTDTYKLAAFLDRWCSEHSIPKSNVIVFPDASGAARSTSGKSDHRILKDAGYRVHRMQKNPFVKDRVNCVNGLLTTRNGRPARLRVTPDCKHVDEAFSKQVWDTSTRPAQPDKKHGWDHIPDAIGYNAWARFPLRTAASLGETKRQPEPRKAA